MLKQLKAWLNRPREIQMGRVANWSERVSARHQRAQAERDGQCFHYAPPQRWTPRPMGGKSCTA